MKKISFFLLFVFFVSSLIAQEKYAEGYFEVQVVDEAFFKTKILSDSERNRDVIAENMTYYNRMIKAYNEKNYKDAKKWAEEAFLGSIGEKIQFKVYQEKFDYAHELMENQKLILFVSLCELQVNVAEIQDVFDYCKEVLSEDRYAFVKERAVKFNTTHERKIVIDKTYSYE